MDPTTAPPLLPRALEPAALRALDGRRGECRALRTRYAELIAAMGGPQRVSPQRAMIAWQIVRTEETLDQMDAEAAAGHAPSPNARATVANTLLGLLRSLGLDRHQPSVHELYGGAA